MQDLLGSNDEPSLLYPHKQSLGVYRNHPVCPFMYLVSATPPKPLIGFL